MIRSDHKGTDRHCQGLCCGGRGCQRFAAFGGLCGHGGLGTVAGEFPYLNEVPVLVGVLFWGAESADPDCQHCSSASLSKGLQESVCCSQEERGNFANHVRHLEFHTPHHSPRSQQAWPVVCMASRMFSII